MATTRNDIDESTATTPRESSASARHILGVAARLFAERGYDATSVREIVEVAGVAKPTLYYHFGSKEGLAQALLTEPLGRLLDAFDLILDSEPDPRVAVTRMLEVLFDFCGEDPDRARFANAVYFGPLGGGLAAELGKFAERIDGHWRRAAERLGAAGLVEPNRISDCATALHGVAVLHTMRFLYRGEEPATELPRRIVRDVLDGFSPREASTGEER